MRKPSKVCHTVAQSVTAAVLCAALWLCRLKSGREKRRLKKKLPNAGVQPKVFRMRFQSTHTLLSGKVCHRAPSFFFSLSTFIFRLLTRLDSVVVEMITLVQCLTFRRSTRPLINASRHQPPFRERSLAVEKEISRTRSFGHRPVSAARFLFVHVHRSIFTADISIPPNSLLGNAFHSPRYLLPQAERVETTLSV